MIFALLSKSERRSGLVIIAYLIMCTVLEVVSVAALIPLIKVLTNSNLRSKYPVIARLFPNSNDQFIVTLILIGVVFVFLLKGLFSGFSLWVQRGYVARLESRFQNQLFDKYTQRGYEFHITNNSAFLSRNILNSNNFINNVLDPIFILLTDGSVAVALCIFLITVEPFAMLITISLVGTAAFVLHGFSKRRIEHWGVERQLKDGLKLQHMNFCIPSRFH